MVIYFFSDEHKKRILLSNMRFLIRLVKQGEFYFNGKLGTVIPAISSIT